MKSHVEKREPCRVAGLFSSEHLLQLGFLEESVHEREEVALVGIAELLDVHTGYPFGYEM